MRFQIHSTLLILFVGAVCSSHLMAAQYSGFAMTQIVPGADYGDPAWSPDGSMIALSIGSSGASAIAVVSAQGGTPQLLTTLSDENRWPCWSPDGSRIAFTRRSGNAGIWTMNIAGNDLQQLVAYGEEPHWSPDGTTIAFTGSSGIELVSSSGGAPTALLGAEGGQAPYWAPNGSDVAFEIDGVGIYKVSATGGTAEAIYLDDSAEEPSWSRDGQWMVFQAKIGGGATELWGVSILGQSSPTRLVSGAQLGADAYSPDFGPSGDIVLVAGCCTAAQGLWVASNLATPVSQTTWSAMKNLFWSN